MSDPDRLLDDPAVSPEAKELLGSLPVPAALGGLDRSAIGSRVATSLAAPAALKVASLKVAGLWAAVVAGGTAAVSFAVVTSSDPPAAPAANARAVATVAPAPSVKDVERAIEPIATVEAESFAPPKTPAAARSAPKRDTLALEESLLEQARRSIGTPARALSLLHEHERRFPNGALTAERLYLTAQTQARAGNQTAARHYAKLLVERFPKSTYVPRVQPLLGGP